MYTRVNRSLLRLIHHERVACSCVNYEHVVSRFLFFLLFIYLFIFIFLNLEKYLLNSMVFLDFIDRYSPTLSGAVIACNILKDLEGIALPMYFFGSGTCCSLGGRFACISSIIITFFLKEIK